jgi:hypothetical protein
MTPERLDRLETAMEKQNQVIDKHSAAIRDLIVVGRTTLTSIQELHATQAEHAAETGRRIKDILKSIEELREAQATTDEKLHIFDRYRRPHHRSSPRICVVFTYR